MRILSEGGFFYRKVLRGLIEKDPCCGGSAIVFICALPCVTCDRRQSNGVTQPSGFLPPVGMKLSEFTLHGCEQIVVLGGSSIPLILMFGKKQKSIIPSVGTSPGSTSGVSEGPSEGDITTAHLQA